MQIEGMHNVYNAMAAALATLAAGIDPKQIKRSIYDFSPVEHRLEPSGTKNDIQWVNDSKATNVDSVWYALESMKRPTVWIAGGTDKGNDYTPIKEFARRKVKALVCMGVDNTKLLRDFQGIVPEIRDCHTFEEAMAAAKELATEGDTVLLSPACASFDLFRNYEERGRMFKEWVKENVLNK
jgi:UDP-N-acetylmuramoylalanine--D-glutamate ligase